MRQKLIAHKRMLGLLNLSRASVWRAQQLNIAGFPKPVCVGKRVFWQEDDLPAIEAAMLRYEGRGVFEAKRKRASAEIAGIELGSTPPRVPVSPPSSTQALLKPKRRTVRRGVDATQRDLFET